MEGYNFKKVRDTLRDYGMDLQINLKNNTALLHYKEKKAPVAVTKNGVILPFGFEEMIEYIKGWEGKEKSQEIARKIDDIKNKPNNLEGTLNVSMIVISLALIVLTFVRAGIFTGNAISDLGDATIDLSVIIGLIVLGGLFFWKQKLNK